MDERELVDLLRYVIAPILPNPQDQEDCLSETALRVWERSGQFEPARGSWTAWLTAVARNTALDYARRQARRHTVGQVEEHMPSPEPTPRRRRCCSGSGRRRWRS